MTRMVLRLALALSIVAAGLGLGSAIGRVGPAAPVCAAAAASHRAGLVVEHGDGRVVRRCVGFDSASITALGVLEASGLETGLDSYGSLGTAVCQIDDEPAMYSTCLPSSGSYWVLFVSSGGGAWADSARGASSVAIAPGDDVGFRYDPQAGADPPPPSPAGTCPAATAAPEVTSPPRSRTPGSATPPPVASGPPATSTPAAAVLGASTPGAGPPPRQTRSGVATGAAAGVNPGFLAAAAGGGGLLGLLGIQGMRRRRR